MLNSEPRQQQLEAWKKHIRRVFLLTAPHQSGIKQFASLATKEIEKEHPVVGLLHAN